MARITKLKCIVCITSAKLLSSTKNFLIPRVETIKISLSNAAFNPYL